MKTFRRLTIYFVGLFLVVSMLSCNDSSSNTSITTIDLKNSLNNAPNELKDSLKVEKIIPLQITDKSILSSNIYIVDVNSEYIVIRSKSRIYFFSYPSGEYKFSIYKRGQGPHEYANLGDVLVYSKEKEVKVLDIHRNKIITYGFDAEFKNEIKNINLQSLLKIDDDCSIGYNEDSNYRISLFDKNWNIKDSFLRRKAKKFDAFRVINSFEKADELVYTKLKDTVFRFDNQQLEPYLYISKGSLSIPDEVMYNLSKKGQRYKYIWGDWIRIYKNYMFLTFIYRNHKYFDIWNINNTKLLYRNKISTPEERQGVPILVGNTKVYYWIDYVKNNKMYAIIKDDEIENLNLDNNNEYNPVVLEIKN